MYFINRVMELLLLNSLLSLGPSGQWAAPLDLPSMTNTDANAAGLVSSV